MRKITETNSHDFGKPEGSIVVDRTTVRSEMGQAFVELALVMPIFILLLVGAAELGRLAYASIEVSNAARAGVAYGARNQAAASDTAGIRQAATLDASNVTSMTPPVVTLSCSCANGTSTPSVSCATAATSCVGPNRIVESVQVQTSATVNTAFHFPGIPNSVTLQGQAIMRVE